MGRNAILSALVFAAIGFIAAVYVLSWSSISNLPLALALFMCPAAIVGSLAAGSEGDALFIWTITLLNAMIYAGVGILVAKIFRFDDESRR